MSFNFKIFNCILITCDHYFYNGKKIHILEKIEDILKQIPSIKKTLVFAYNKKEENDKKSQEKGNKKEKREQKKVIKG